jgi:uroporphyrinogen decarboxylase
MTPRDRVLTALDHREPDRVPIEFGSPATLSMIDGEPYGYGALLDLLGIGDAEPPILARAFSNSVTNIDPRVLERFGADLRWVGAGGADLEERPDGRLFDPWWGYELIPLGAINQADDAAAPLRAATSWAEIAAHPSWPDPTDPRLVGDAPAAAARHRGDGYAVVANPAVGCLVFHHYQRLRGFDTWLYDMVDDPALYHRLCERILELDLAIMERFLPSVGPSIDLVFMADDLGSQEGMLVSPDAYRRFLKPYQAAWIEAARRLAPGTRIAYHSCGSFREVIPDLIEIGVEVLTPIQPLARDMDPAGLKRDFGRDLSFMGGLDTQRLLPRGTPDEVRQGARELIDALAPGGGFIFAASHELLPDVPPANIDAMFDEAQRYGRYR